MVTQTMPESKRIEKLESQIAKLSLELSQTQSCIAQIVIALSENSVALSEIKNSIRNWVDDHK